MPEINLKESVKKYDLYYRVKAVEEYKPKNLEEKYFEERN